ncbi:MAG: hypothetical protein ACK5LC_09940 [Coprobacillaceae bacterium]
MTFTSQKSKIATIKNYKPSKNLDEMISYLQDTKNIVFNEITKEEAKNILFEYNYINVISPFKHYFALTDKQNRPIKDKGKHIYNRTVDFKEYYEKYREERDAYPTIMENIIRFETKYKAILAYHVFNTEVLETSNDLSNFISKLNVYLLSQIMAHQKKRKGIFQTLKDTRIKNMQKQVQDLLVSIDSYHDIYCFFDRQSLGTVLTIFTCLPFDTQNNIFKDLKKADNTLKTNEVPGFIRKTFTLVSIRNRVMHSNSFEILLTYYNERIKKYREPDEKKKIKKVIELLSIPLTDETKTKPTQ